MSPTVQSQSSEQAYTAWVDELVSTGVPRSAGDFGQLVDSLPGVFPTEVLASLRRLQKSRNSDPGWELVLYPHATRGRSESMTRTESRSGMFCLHRIPWTSIGDSVLQLSPSLRQRSVPALRLKPVWHCSAPQAFYSSSERNTGRSFCSKPATPQCGH